MKNSFTMAEQHVEDCCLHFENHGGILTETFQNFLERKAFVDVTLICSNGRRIKAHKTMLAAYSPFFENMLMEESNPVVLLNDITEQELEAILEIIYKGTVNISRTFLPNVRRTAKRLQIRGLEHEKCHSSEANHLTQSSSQKGTPSAPPSPIIRKYDNTVKVINPFAMKRRIVEDSDSTCIENESLSRVKIRKCQGPEEPVIHEATSASKEEDSDVEFVEENPLIVIVTDTQKPSESPPWFRKTQPKIKRHMRSNPYASNKEKNSSGTEKSTVEKNVAGLEPPELVPQATTTISESQNITTKTSVQKAKEKPNGSLPGEKFIKKGFQALVRYCVVCDSFQRNIKQHVNCLHSTPPKRTKFTCQTCSKKYFRKNALQCHKCTT